DRLCVSVWRRAFALPSVAKAGAPGGVVEGGRTGTGFSVAMSHGPDRGSRRPKADLVDDTLHTVFIAGSWPISALAIIGLCALFGPAPAVAAASGASNILPGLPDTASINACLSRAAVSCSASASRTQSGDDPPEVQQPEISTAFAINAKGEFLTNYHAVA